MCLICVSIDLLVLAVGNECSKSKMKKLGTKFHEYLNEDRGQLVVCRLRAKNTHQQIKKLKRRKQTKEVLKDIHLIKNSPKKVRLCIKN